MRSDGEVLVFSGSASPKLTRAVCGGDAAERLDRSPTERIFVTDTVENHPVPLPSRTRIVSIAPLLAEAIARIQRRESISVLFRD